MLLLLKLLVLDAKSGYSVVAGATVLLSVLVATAVAVVVLPLVDVAAVISPEPMRSCPGLASFFFRSGLCCASCNVLIAQIWATLFKLGSHVLVLLLYVCGVIFNLPVNTM